MPLIVIYAASAMLLIGAAPLPYGFYTLLRIVACAVFAFAAYTSFTRQQKLLPWAYGFLAIVFNPIIKIHLPKEAWIVVDIAAGLFLIATAKKIKSD